MPVTLWIALGLMLVAGILLAMGTLPLWKKYVDQDGDGDLDLKDAEILAKNIADVNNDGKVDGTDLDLAKDQLKEAAKKVNAVVGATKK